MREKVEIVDCEVRGKEKAEIVEWESGLRSGKTVDWEYWERK